jgi:pre-mRNA-splicing factor CWC22
MISDQPTGGRTGGVYIPPFKLAFLKKQQQQLNQNNNIDKDNENEQRISWEALRKSINGLINKVNISNIKNIIPELFQENMIRGRGIFARAIMKAQLASPGFTHIYAS